jgi:uncharacterized membrane protein
MAILITGLALFLGVHLLPAVPPLRAALVARWSERRYKGRFSLLAAVGLVLIVTGYAVADDRARVFAPFPLARTIAPFAMVASFILFAAANMRGHLRRIVQHPMLLGLLLWSSVHLLANGDRVGTVLFGSFLAYAVADLVSAVGRGAAKQFVPQPRHDLIAVAGGTAVALAVMTFHRVLFGAPVVPFGV